MGVGGRLANRRSMRDNAPTLNRNQTNPAIRRMSFTTTEIEARDDLPPAVTERQSHELSTEAASNAKPVAESEPECDRPPRTLLRRADQLGIAVLSLFALVTIGGYWINQAVVRHRVIDLDKAPPLDPSFRVDINSADWPELAQLPEMGESLARKIVTWRKEHGPFKDLTDLRRVKGIGPKKFEAVRPFLRPIERAAATADRDVAEQEKSVSSH
jgi:competence protein ComEA